MKKLSLFFLSVFTSSIVFAQTKPKSNSGTPAVPKLVVGIVVDQMRYDYIYRYWNKYSDNGFKRLVNQGFFCRNANYNYVPTYTGPGHASIYTGSTPAVHGIIANDWYRKNEKDTMYCVADASAKTVGAVNASGKMSPANLITTTITDELRLVTNFKAQVFGISMKDRGAILPAGHAANAAYWFDGSTGNWVTSSYYMNELPKWVQGFNDKKLPTEYLSKPWETLQPIERYTESTADDTPYEQPFRNETKPLFPHNFAAMRDSASPYGAFEMIRRSPLGNRLTTDFAKELILNERIGRDDVTDFLAISYSCTDYVGHQFGTYAIETEDTYLRLDKDLGNLFDFLDAYVGASNTLIFLTADHGASQNAAFLNDNKLPGGTFPFNAVKDSLNKFLKAKYGEGNWMECFDNNQVFLNHSLLEKNNMDIKEVANVVADFLLQFKDVAATLTAEQLNGNQYTDIPRSLVQRGFNMKRSGDVAVILNPNILDWELTKGTTHAAPWSYDTHVPLLWMGWKIKKGESSEPVYINDIAPTLSLFLNTAFPSGTTGKPIQNLRF